MNRHLGEDGLTGESIIRLPEKYAMPFWMDHHEDKNISARLAPGPDFIGLCLSRLSSECFEKKLFFDSKSRTRYLALKESFPG